MQRLISATHHIVTQDSRTGVVMKRAGKHPHATDELMREYEVWCALGEPAIWRGDGFSLPDHGTPLPEWNESSIQQVSHLIDDLTRIRLSEVGAIPGAEWWPSIVRTKIAHRVGGNHSLRRQLIQATILPDWVDLSGPHLVHTDIHLANVLRSHDGTLTLIDWETPLRGHPEITRGCFEFALSLAGHPQSISSHPIAQQARRLKSASTASWAYADCLRRGESVESAGETAEMFFRHGVSR